MRTGVVNISLFDDEFLGDDLPKAQPRESKTSKAVTHSAFEVQTLWQSCLDAIRLEMSEIEFNQWLKPLKPQIADGRLLLYAINPVFIRRINQHYLATINQLLAQYSDGQLTAEVRVDSPPKANKTNKKRSSSAKVARIDESDAIDARCTFENFVKSRANTTVYNACYELAKSAGQEVETNNHLLFIYGASGLGKTHLMQAVAHRYQKAGLSYCYFTKDGFFKTTIQAMRGEDGGVDELAKRIAKADLLMIDDVHMINEKNGPKVSQFLMVLFEKFTKNDKRLILASNRPPSQLQDLDTRFLSRFSGGLTLSIEPPDIEARVQILQKKALALQMQLPKDCAIFIARHAPPDVRSLEGALTQVRANLLMQDEQITLALVRHAIKDRVEARAKAINAQNIRDVVAEYYGVSVKDLTSKKRQRSIARPRQMAMALIRELTCDSYPEIGQFFGGRDHTTVIHACEKVAERRSLELVVENDYQALIAMLRFA